MSHDDPDIQEIVPPTQSRHSRTPCEALLWRVELIRDRLEWLEDEVEGFKELIEKLTLEDDEQK